MLKHVSFITRRPNALLPFYARLGGTLQKDTTAPDGLRRIVIRFGNGGRLQFFAAPATDEFTASDVTAPGASWMEHVAVEVPDLLSCVHALKESGVAFSRELQRTPGGNPVAFALDPDGRHVELLQQDATGFPTGP